MEGGEEEKVEGEGGEDMSGRCLGEDGGGGGRGEPTTPSEEEIRLSNSTFSVRAGLGYLPQTFGAGEEPGAVEPLTVVFWCRGGLRGGGGE